MRGIVLLTLASAQFLMTLDSSVMNVSIATVAKDVGTTVTGIQLAITLYTLVMAAFMITGGKVGQILGRKRAFMIGCVIYGGGSLTTALAGSLPVLHPRLVVPRGHRRGSDHARPSSRWWRRTSAHQIAPGPTAWSPRLLRSRSPSDPWSEGCARPTSPGAWVFVGEVVIVIGILLLARRMTDAPAVRGVRLDPIGTCSRQPAWE